MAIAQPMVDQVSLQMGGLEDLGDMMGDHTEVDASHVPPEIYGELSRVWTKERPSCPFSWMVSYTGRKALGNIRIFESGAKHCSLAFPIRVFISTWTHAIVTSFVSLESIREAHVLEWFTTFYEVPVEEAKTRLAEFPDWPYDGRNPDLAAAELRTGPAAKELLKASRERLATLGITVPSKF